MPALRPQNVTRSPADGTDRNSVRDLFGTYGFQVTTLSSSLTLWMARRLNREFGVTTVEWRVLAFLVSFGECAARDIAEATLMDKGNVSRAIHSLTRKGCLNRREDRADRRVARLRVTGKGRRLHDRIAVISDERQARLADALSSDERRQFDHIFGKLTDAAKSMLSETMPPRGESD